MTQKADSNCESTLGADILWGASAVAEELKIDTRAAEHLIKDGSIPAGKVGGKIVASRRRLREFFEHVASGGQTAT